MKTRLLFVIVTAALLLTGATVWEGVTNAAAAKDLPGTYSVATNSFPRNTVVDITNLENDKMVRVIVISGLETTGLLATLSQNAADAIDLRHDSRCRIRITQPRVDVSSQTQGAPRPQYQLGPIDSAGVIAYIDEIESTAAVSVVAPAPASTETTPAANISTATAPAPVFAPAPVTIAKPPATEIISAPATMIAASEPVAPVADNIIAADMPEAIDDLIAIIEPTVTTNAMETETPAWTADAGTTSTVTVNEIRFEPQNTSGAITLVPAEERLPPTKDQPVKSANVSLNVISAPGNTAVVPPSVTRTAENPASNTLPSEEFSPFQVPLISSLAPGKWYVQLCVYSRPDNVEDEINRIGSAYPLAIQNVGTDTSPIFRVLLGPLNQGESGALLQRFKSIGYTDAFVRNN